LKSILSILSIEEGLNQTQIAKKLKITQGAAKEYLNELIKINLIVKKDNTYHFIDPIFRYWIAYVQEGVEIGGYPSEKDLHSLVKDLDKKFQQASRQLGIAKEYEFKVKIEEKFDIQFSNYISRDRKREFDLVGKKDDVYYIVEVKWRNRKVSIKDILDFSKKIQHSIFSDKKKTMLFISKSGFDEKALQEAHKEEIHCLDKNLNKKI
jgi:predicted transcriptional regulator